MLIIFLIDNNYFNNKNIKKKKKELERVLIAFKRSSFFNMNHTVV